MLSMVLPHDESVDVVWPGDLRVGCCRGSNPGWAGDMDMAGTAGAGAGAGAGEGAGKGASSGAWDPMVAAVSL
jgi:hypothetical protein